VKETTVRDVMTNSVVTTSPNAPFKYVLRIMQDHRISGVPVVDDAGRLMGIVSEADLLKAESTEPPRRNFFLEWFVSPARIADLERRSEDLRAEDVMTRDVVTVRAETSVTDAVRTLLGAGVKRLPVTDEEGRVVGIVSRADLLRPFLRSDVDIRREVIEEVILGAMWIDPSTLDVRVLRGVVTVTGRVERRSEKEILVLLIRRVSGVVGLHDQLSYEEDDLALGRRIPLPETLRTRFR
jgi:CBS-domain-containing membrane protein